MQKQSGTAALAVKWSFVKQNKKPTMPLGVNLKRSQELYRAAQVHGICTQLKQSRLAMQLELTFCTLTASHMHQLLVWLSASHMRGAFAQKAVVGVGSEWLLAQLCANDTRHGPAD